MITDFWLRYFPAINWAPIPIEHDSWVSWPLVVIAVGVPLVLVFIIHFASKGIYNPARANDPTRIAMNELNEYKIDMERADIAWAQEQEEREFHVI